MIFIQSELDDVSTNDVLDWLYYLSPERNVSRLNDTQTVQKIYIRIHEKERINIRVGGQNLSSADIDSRWYRRGRITFSNLPPCTENEELFVISNTARNYINREMNYILKSTDSFINYRNTINKYNDNFTNKISNLIIAAKIGLKVPDTLITNETQEILSFVQKHQKVITKGIAYNDFSVHLNNATVNISCTTTLVEPETVKQLAGKRKSSIPALYQEYIEKKYELRIFYLMGSFYPMAIFSQADESTRIDFRNPEARHHNRCMPYALPGHIEKHLSSLMDAIEMNCGSIDIVVTPQNEYIFLEVNPVGQFEWLSKNCNYDIERRIAYQLIQNEQ